MPTSRSRTRIAAALWALCALGTRGARAEEAWLPAAEALALAESAAGAVPLRAARDARVGGAVPACRAPLAGLEAGAPAAGRAEKLACLEAAFAARVSPGRVLGGSPLDAEQRAAVAVYVDHFAYLINKALRTGDEAFVRRHDSFVRTLTGALDRSPSFHGVVFRGADFLPAGVRLDEGVEFVDPAFVSTSRSWDIAEHYTKVDGYFYVILSRSGRVVAYDRTTQDLSEEDEVLFKPGTRFAVLAALADPQRRRTIVLAEDLTE